MWLEPAAGLVSMQLGKVFDHTKEEYFRVPLEQGQSHWSEPYKDIVGANTLVTDILIPVGAMGMALFTGWFVPKARYQGSRLGTFIYLFILRWLVPIALILIFLNSLNII